MVIFNLCTNSCHDEDNLPSSGVTSVLLTGLFHPYIARYCVVTKKISAIVKATTFSCVQLSVPQCKVENEIPKKYDRFQ